MFDHKHYVPVLKSKAGERRALAQLTPARKAHITPLLELHEHEDLDTEGQAADICSDLAERWGTVDPFFLDTILHHDATGDPTVITAVFDAARTYGVQAIPVVRPTYSPAALAAVAAVAATDGRGCMVRATPGQLSAAAINSALAGVHLPATSVHFMIDYVRQAMTLPSHVPPLAHLNDWRSLSAASGAFPASVFNLAAGAWHAIARTDWTSWLAGVTGGGLPRRPAFADYATRDPGRPATFGDPIVNVRYTTDAEWRVGVGGKHKLGLGHQMRGVCASLIAQAFYSGPRFSAGDGSFHATAAPASQYGGPTQWLQWSLNHHLEFAANQIRSHPGI